MSEEDRVVAAAGTAEEHAADGSSFRFRLVAHDPGRVPWLLRGDGEPRAVVRPARALGSPPRPGRAARRGLGAPTRLSTLRSPPQCSKSSSRRRRPRCSSRTTTSIVRRRSCGLPGPTHAWRTSSTFPGSGPTRGASSRGPWSSACTRGCSRTTVSASTPNAGGRPSARCARTSWAGATTHGRAPTRTRSPSTWTSSTPSSRATRCAARATSWPPTGRRCSWCASTARIPRRTRCAASRRSASCSTAARTSRSVSSCSHFSTRRGRRSPSTSTTGMGSSDAAADVNSAARPAGLGAGRPARPGRLRRLRRRVHGVRRPARQPRARRAQSRREGGASRQSPRRRARAVARRRRLGRARGVGDRRRPARRRGHGGCARARYRPTRRREGGEARRDRRPCALTRPVRVGRAPSSPRWMRGVRCAGDHGASVRRDGARLRRPCDARGGGAGRRRRRPGGRGGGR